MKPRTRRREHEFRGSKKTLIPPDILARKGEMSVVCLNAYRPKQQFEMVACPRASQPHPAVLVVGISLGGNRYWRQGLVLAGLFSYGTARSSNRLLINGSARLARSRGKLARCLLNWLVCLLNSSSRMDHQIIRWVIVPS